MSLEWVLFALRLLATSILYIFLGVAFYLIWRQLRQTQTQQLAGLPQKVDRLRVIASDEGQPLVVGQILPLQPGMLLGRGPDGTVVFDFADDVRLTRQDEAWRLENLGQSDNVKLNDAPLSKSKLLVHGDVIAVGDIHFRFETGE